LIGFMALGTLLLGAKQLTADGRALGLGAEPIRVPAAQVEQLQAQWFAETRRWPTRAELQASVRRHADEELLVREALRRGLDRSDPVVRSRLTQNLRFARGASAGDDAALFAEALALGMAHRDVVARRRLVQAMEEHLAAGTGVSDAEVRAYIAAHTDRYATRRRISFEQVFVSSDRHRGRLAERAAEVGARIAAMPRAQALALSDPFLHGQRFQAQSEADLARAFGPGFAAAAIAAPAGAWTGPLPSPYGEHFVHVVSEQPAGRVDVAAVQRQARYALLDERERTAVRRELAALRRAYPLRVEWPALALGAGS
jgi:hypothetical protein